MIPATVPEQKRGVLEGDSELDRTVILFNVALSGPRLRASAAAAGYVARAVC